MVHSIPTRALRLALIGASCLTGLAAAPAFAQQAAPAASNADTVEEVVVTGFRKSLADATNAKRESITFQDSVFAEDIGKFPDLNIAESLNRIPGIQLTREINGDGLNIAVRGLGTNFTKILLNGSQIAVASSGRTDAQNQNREVDLNLFPTELFTRLDVSKTPTASQAEGGVAGVVNMRNARPLDRPGRHFTYSAQGSYQESAGKWSPRGAILASDSWDTSHGEFGLLLGYAGVRTKSRTDGFETIGWTNANLTYAQCGTTPPVTTPPTAVTAAGARLQQRHRRQRLQVRRHRSGQRRQRPDRGHAGHGRLPAKPEPRHHRPATGRRPAAAPGPPVLQRGQAQPRLAADLGRMAPERRPGLL